MKAGIQSLGKALNGGGDTSWETFNMNVDLIKQKDVADQKKKAAEMVAVFDSLKKEADKPLLEILISADFKHIFLSYNNEGFISPSRIKEMMTGLGHYECSCIKYPRFKSHRDDRKSYTKESLHHLIKY